MIFVVLGSQDKKFTRLLKEIDRLIDKKVINDKVIVQAGITDYKSDNMEVHDFFDMGLFNQYINEANLVITHGGVGTILDALKKNKKVIAVARREEYDEHANNHQLQIINDFSKKGCILGCENVSELEEKIKAVTKFKPKEYESNNEKFVNMIDSFINK